MQGEISKIRARS
ncbi:unnamed protein product [Lathyrus oleraceus]